MIGVQQLLYNVSVRDFSSSGSADAFLATVGDILGSFNIQAVRITSVQSGASTSTGQASVVIMYNISFGFLYETSLSELNTYQAIELQLLQQSLNGNFTSVIKRESKTHSGSLGSCSSTVIKQMILITSVPPPSPSFTLSPLAESPTSNPSSPVSGSSNASTSASGTAFNIITIVTVSVACFCTSMVILILLYQYVYLRRTKSTVVPSIEEGSRSSRILPLNFDVDNIEMRPVLSNTTIARNSIGRVSSFSAASQRVPDTDNRRSSLFGLGEGDDRLSQQNILDSWPMGLARPDGSVSTPIPVSYVRAGSELVTPVQNKDRLSLQRLQPSSSSSIGMDKADDIDGLFRDNSISNSVGDYNSARLSGEGRDRTDSSRPKGGSNDGQERLSDEDRLSATGRGSGGTRIDLGY